MSREGKLKPGSMGMTMPVNAPGFVDKPPFWRGVNSYTFNYETDADAAAGLVPEGLILPEPVTACLIFNDFEWSTGGPYLELLQGINAEFEGESCLYFPQLAVSETVPLMAGREIYGFPKKVGHLKIIRQDDILALFYERPAGLRIATGVFRQLRPIDPQPDKVSMNGVNLRVITSPEPDKNHSLCELILAELVMSNVEIWSGEGNCSYAGISELDPWHHLPVVRHLDCSFMKCDATMGTARILKRW